MSRTDTNTPLTAERVTQVFADCLFRDGEDTTGHVPAYGLMCLFGFHPGRLESHRADIASMLAELPDQFQATRRGCSFMQACMDRHGSVWTALYYNIEQLFVLGIATNQADYAQPRELWHTLPGSLPFLTVHPDPSVKAN